MGKRLEVCLHVGGILVTMAGALISFVNGDWMPWLLIYGAIMVGYCIVGDWMARVWRIRDLEGRTGEEE